MNRIIVFDDEQDFLDSVKRGLSASGFKNVHLEKNPMSFVREFEVHNPFDIALIDISMPELTGTELLAFFKSRSPHTECIMVSALNEVRTVVNCLKKGAYDFLTKPVALDVLCITIERALERKRFLEILTLQKKSPAQIQRVHKAFRTFITGTPRIQTLLREAELHASSNVSILITGESGTGKELMARAIHEASPRASGPFTPVNMASLTASLFDAEFFGHTRGAFTGADKARNGYIEHTSGGTLFLDEIGDLPLDLQGKLLRVLQEGEYMKLGTIAVKKADIRFIAATNMDLNRLMQKGLFRKDLFYRLQGAWLEIPPLRERKEDIPLLIDRFLDEFTPLGECKYELDQNVAMFFMEYTYPGNVRELRSIIQSAVNLCPNTVISMNHLHENLRKKAEISQPVQTCTSGQPVLPLAVLEKKHILSVYESTGQNKSKTARLLDISLKTLRRKIEAYGTD